MSKSKKVIAFILLAVLSFSCSVVSFAEEDTEAANLVEIHALYAEFANIQASSPSPQNLGVTIKFTAVASGSSLQYRFTRILGGTKTVFRDWATSNTAYCNPQSAGSYTILVEVRDSSGSVSELSIPYTWIDPNAPTEPPTEPPVEPSLPSGDVDSDDFMIGVNWLFSAVKVLWNFITGMGFVGYCVIGVLVVKRVSKLIAKSLHK